MAVAVSPSSATSRQGFGTESVSLDAHDNDDDGAAGPVATTQSLQSGVTYLITVDGTWSTWDESTWDNPGACGTSEPAPQHPSSGVTNGPVSADAEFVFAEPAWGGEDCSATFPRHYAEPFVIDVGSGFVHEEPITGVPQTPPSDHRYQYRVTGQGPPVSFQLVDDPSSDNYGVFQITVQEDTEDVPDECNDPGAICGSSEDENIQGSPEDEFIYGGGGNDSIDGGGGNDVITGASGNDVIQGGPGKDRITGGAGKDRIVGDARRTSSASRTSRGYAAAQEGAAADRIDGGGGDDSVAGGGGSDKILGAAGNDALKGDAGNDLLKGGEGVNDFNGGPGRDTCVLGSRRDETRSCEKKQRSFQRSFFPIKYLRAQ